MLNWVFWIMILSIAKEATKVYHNNNNNNSLIKLATEMRLTWQREQEICWELEEWEDIIPVQYVGDCSLQQQRKRKKQQQPQLKAMHKLKL